LSLISILTHPAFQLLSQKRLEKVEYEVEDVRLVHNMDPFYSKGDAVLKKLDFL
jgi:hypothetical protein